MYIQEVNYFELQLPTWTKAVYFQAKVAGITVSARSPSMRSLSYTSIIKWIPCQLKDWGAVVNCLWHDRLPICGYRTQAAFHSGREITPSLDDRYINTRGRVGTTTKRWHTERKPSPSLYTIGCEIMMFGLLKARVRVKACVCAASLLQFLWFTKYSEV
jgi:hypothetical protein